MAELKHDIPHRHEGDGSTGGKGRAGPGLRAAVELAAGLPGVLVLTLDSQGRLTYINQKALGLFGYGREELMGRNPAGTLLPDGGGSLLEPRAMVSRLVADPARQQCGEHQTLSKDGRPVWVSWNCRSLPGENQGDPEVLCMGWDITGLGAPSSGQTGLVALPSARCGEFSQAAGVYPSVDCSFYQALVENSSDGMVVLRENGELVFDSPSSERILGYTFAQTQGTNALEYLHPDDVPRVAAILAEKAHEPGAKVSVQYRARHIDGSWRHVEAKGHNLLYDERVRGIIITYRDVTERIEAEQALRESEERFRATMQSTPDSITVTALRDGRYLYVNDGFCQLTGFSREEALAGNPVQLGMISLETRQRILDALRENGQVAGLEIGYRVRSGQVLDCLFSGRPIMHEGQRCLVSVVKDISALKATMEEKDRLEAQLRQAQKMEAIGTLAGGIAHDFNNILSAIIGYAEISVDDLEEGRADMLGGNLREILTAAIRARDLVRQILTFSRQQEQMRGAMVLADLAGEVLKLLRATLPRTIDISLEDRSEGGVVLADSTQMHQMVMNLCTNSSQAMRDTGGKLSVSLDKVRLDAGQVAEHPDLEAREYVRLLVEDNGPGIPPEYLDRIFDPFFTTKEQGQGTGMGLAVVHGIVKGHGGAVRVDSALGRGTRVEVLLPLHRAAQSSRDDREDEAATGHGRIMVVDDEEALVGVVGTMLERLGYKVARFTSSREALEVFSASPMGFDLIVTDQTMPQLTGLQLAAEARALRPGMPILLCTGFSEQVHDEASVMQMVSGLMMKPVSKRELAGRVAELVKH